MAMFIAGFVLGGFTGVIIMAVLAISADGMQR